MHVDRRWFIQVVHAKNPHLADEGVDDILVRDATHSLIYQAILSELAPFQLGS
jgi:hypothetical protein